MVYAETDLAPSTFLTATAGRCLSHTLNFGFAQGDVLTIFDWLYAQQIEDGSFVETGFSPVAALGVIEQDARTISTTATSLLSILSDPRGARQAAVDSAVSFLRQAFENGAVNRDPFTTAVTLYALVKAGAASEDPTTLTLASKLESANVGSASYALLSHLLLQNAERAESAAEYLFSAREANGLMGSEMESILGSDALFAYSGAILWSPKMDLTVVTLNPSKLFRITTLNRRVSQRIEQIELQGFQAVTHGVGQVALQIIDTCNTLQANSVDKGLQILVSWSGSEVSSPTVQVCIIRSSMRQSSEAILAKVQLLTGYRAAVASLRALLSENSVLDYTERDGTIEFLVNAESARTCFEFSAQRVFGAVNLVEANVQASSAADGALAESVVPGCEVGSEGTVSNPGLSAILATDAGPAFECRNGQAVPVSSGGIEWWVWLLVAIGCVLVAIVFGIIVWRCWLKEKKRKKERFDRMVALKTNQSNLTTTQQFLNSSVGFA